MKHGRIQAKDIPDAVVLDAVRRTRGRNSVPAWATTWDLIEAVPGVPPKVLLARCRAMIRRRALEGHACRLTAPYCRGDFAIPVVTSAPRPSPVVDPAQAATTRKWADEQVAREFRYDTLRTYLGGVFVGEDDKGVMIADLDGAKGLS